MAAEVCERGIGHKGEELVKQSQDKHKLCSQEASGGGNEGKYQFPVLQYISIMSTTHAVWKSSSNMLETEGTTVVNLVPEMEARKAMVEHGGCSSLRNRGLTFKQCLFTE